MIKKIILILVLLAMLITTLASQLAQAQEQAPESKDWLMEELEPLNLRLNYYNFKTNLSIGSMSSDTSFNGIGVGANYDIKNFYVGADYASFSNKSAFKWSNIRLIGGYQVKELNWIITPVVEVGYGIGSFEESGGSYKISDSKGRVLSLDIGGLYKIKGLGYIIDHLSVYAGYGLMNQDHDSFDQVDSTTLKSQGFKLSILYNF